MRAAHWCEISIDHQTLIVSELPMAQGVSPLLSASAAIAGRIRFIRLLVFLITVVAGGAIADPPTEGSIRIGLIATAVLDPIGLCCASLVGRWHCKGLGCPV